MKEELVLAHVDGMTSIRTTLIASYQVSFLGQNVDDLPLPSSPHWQPTTTMHRHLDHLETRSGFLG